MGSKWCLIFGLIIALSISWTWAHKVKEQNPDWWRHEVFYQIYPRSFKDSNGDGVGDLKGITSKLQYFADTGITSVWLSPIFQSPMKDFGYDISDYRAIQPEYGTLADFDQLIATANKLGIKVILDFVPNHSSDQHEWFKKSVARDPAYDEFYIWENSLGMDDDGKHIPPNNWLSVFSHSAWQWNEDRQQFYLRQFTQYQPDLNYRNPAVVKAMDDILLYWLNRGVAGFRIDAVIYIYEDEQLRDEPISGTTDDDTSEAYLKHIYTRNQPECYPLVQHWRKLLDDYSAKNSGPQRIMMLEAYSDLKLLMDYYEDENGVQGAQFPFNFDFITELNKGSTAQDFVFYIDRWLTYMPAGHAANWVMGNHDNPRVASRYGVQTVDAMNMLLMTLPGIAVTYYGEELGMEDYRDMSYDQTVDQPARDAGESGYKWISRDPERTPFQWSDDKNAGFSTGTKTWLPVHPNYQDLNLRAQQRASRSHYKVYQSLLQLRQTKVLQDGSFIAHAFNRRVFALKRELKGQPTILTIVNVSERNQQVDISDFITVPNKLTVTIVGVNSQYRVGERLKSYEINLAAYEGLVISLKK